MLSSVIMKSTLGVAKGSRDSVAKSRTLTWSNDAIAEINLHTPPRDFSTKLFALWAWLSASACAATALLLFF